MNPPPPPPLEAVHSPAAILIRRELRGEKRLFIFAASVMAAATAALTLVLSLSDVFETTRTAQAQTLLGGDMALRLSQREFSPEERDWLKANSAILSELRNARVLAVRHGLAIGSGRTQLARLKGVEKNYPLFGELRLRRAATTLHAAADADGAIPAYVSESLTVLLGLQIGDLFSAGGLSLRVINIIESEPDPDLRFWMSGAPAVMVAKDAMETGDFMRPGALVERIFRVVLREGESGENWRENLEAEFPDGGWRILSPANAQNSTRRIVNRMRDFLALAALAAMLAAGIGCGNSISAFLRARMRSIAVIKMLGGDGALIRRTYLSLAGLFALSGAVAGAVFGAAAGFAIAPLLSAYLPWALTPSWSVEVMARAVLAATLMTAAFAVPPVLRFARVNPLALFAGGGNDERAPPPAASERLTAAAALALAAAALPLAWDKKIMLVGVAAVALLLYAGALLFAAAIARFRVRNATLRLGMLAIARNRQQTATAVMSFGVGVFVLTAVLNTEINFSQRIDDTLRQQAPALYLAGAQPQQRGMLNDIITAQGGDTLLTPFLRGRITSLGGRDAEELLKTAPPDSRWILRGDRVLTWTADGANIGGSRVVAGTLWNSEIQGLQASFDAEEAVVFGVKLGDKIGMNVLGQPVTAVISSFRAVKWQSFDINFVVILSAPPFPDVPHTYMGAARLPPENVAAAQLALVSALPNVVPIATAPLFSAIQKLLARVAALLRATALFLLATGLPMIVATLVENRRRRQQTAATLRLLGATKTTIVGAGIVEFITTAMLAVIPATLLGALAGRVLVVNIFQLEWQAHWGGSFAVAAVAAAVFLVLGAADIAACARSAPYPMLRNE